MKSYDILIAGVPYTFAGPGITLGGAEKEPAPIGQLGSILIPSLHAGLGPPRDVAPGRYVSAANAVLHKPGLILPDNDLPAAITSYTRGTPLYPWALAYEKGAPKDYAFLVGPQKLYWFDPHLDSPVLAEVAGSDLSGQSGDKRYTGSCFVWNQRWVFGFEEADRSAAGFTTASVTAPPLDFDAASNSAIAGGGVTQLTWAHVCTGSDRLLVVGVATDDVSHTSVTYAGQAMTRLVDQYESGGARVTIWYKVAPATGSNDVVVTVAACDGIVGGAMSFVGVHQGTPLGTHWTANGNTALAEVDGLPSAEDEIVVGALAAGPPTDDPPTVGSQQTSRWNAGAGSALGAGSTQPGETTVWTYWQFQSSHPWAIGAVPIKPASAGGSYTTPTATITDDTAKAASFGAAQRGRVFWTRNKGIGITEVYWAPQQAVDFEDGAFTKYGPINTDTIRATWVTLWGGTLFISREDGSVVGTDETGFLGLALPTPLRRDDSVSSPMLAGSFGRQAAPYLDVLLLPAVDNVWGLNPHSLAARPYDPASVQATDADFLRSIFLSVAAVGIHGFVGGLTLLNADGTGGYVGRIYRLVAGGADLVAHAFGEDFGANQRVISMIPTLRFDSDRDPTLYLYVLTDDAADVRLYRYTLRSDVNPAGAHPTPAVGDPATVILPTLSGDVAQRNISKLFLQVRGRALLPAGGTPKVSFSGATVEGNTVTIADVTASGEFAAAITAATEAYRIGRDIQFTVNLHGTSLGKVIYLPLSIDFLWVPALHDLITITIAASGEGTPRMGGLWQRSSGKAIVDALMALRNTIVTAEFPEGVTGADAQKGTVAWTLFVEKVEAGKGRDITGVGAGEYAVTLTCRRV